MYRYNHHTDWFCKRTKYYVCYFYIFFFSADKNFLKTQQSSKWVGEYYALGITGVLVFGAIAIARLIFRWKQLKRENRQKTFVDGDASQNGTVM